MAILQIRQASERESDANLSKFEVAERELEIKNILSELEVGFEVLVEVAGKITAYRTSFEHYLRVFNKEAGEDRKYSFSKTQNPKQWVILRVK